MPKSSTTPPPATGEVFSSTMIQVDKKGYEIQGGANKHGPFLKVTENIGGRKNVMFFDAKRWTEIRQQMDDAVEAIPLVLRTEGVPADDSIPAPNEDAQV